MNPKLWISVGAIVGFLSVSAGAFGAHAMKDARLEDIFYGGANDKPEFVAMKEYRRRMEIFETATRYQMYHALALVLTGFAGLAVRDRPPTLANVAGILFTLGTFLFCAPLYGLVFLMSEFNWLGAITPIGGVTLLAAWIALALAGIVAVGGSESEQLPLDPAAPTA